MTHSRKLLFIALGLSVLFIFSMYMAGPPEGHSFTYNIAWHTQFSKLLWSGTLVPKYGSELAYGFGGMDLFFYAPMPFYITSTFGEITTFFSHRYDALAVGGAWILIFSGVAFYAFARFFFSNHVAFIASVFYALSPYNFSVNWLGRQAIGEVTATIFIPIIALGLRRILRREGGELLLCFGFAGLLLSHLPTLVLATLYFIPFGFVLALRIPDFRPSVGRKVALATISGSIAIGFGSFYFYPALVLLPDLSAEYLAAHSDRLPEFLMFCFGCETGQIFPAFTTLFLLGYLSICFLFWRIGSDVPSKDGFLWVIYFIGLTVFLNTVFAYPLWTQPGFDMVQFPWRSFLFVDFAASICLGFALTALAKSTAKERRARVAQLFLLAALYTGAMITFVTIGKETYFPRERELPMVSGLEYMTPTASHYFVDVLSQENKIFTHNVLEMESFTNRLREITMGYDRIESDARGYSFTLSSDAAVLPIYAYPRMELHTSEGKLLKTDMTKEGLLSVPNAPAGTTLYYRMPILKAERRAAIVSWVTVIVAMIFFAWLFLSRRYRGS
ncbi:MAG: hypothetical protein AAF429_01990 [Pseudomonadota bacterium]